MENTPELEALVDGATEALKAHALKNYGISPESERDLQRKIARGVAFELAGVQSRGMTLEDVYVLRQDIPRHHRAMFLITPIVNMFIHKYQDKLSSNPAVNARAVNKFATDLYTDILRNGMELEQLQQRGLADKLNQAFLASLDAALHPKPFKIPVVRSLIEGIRQQLNSKTSQHSR